MKHVLTVLFVISVLSGLCPAQTEAVLKTKSTKALTDSIVIPTGKSITINSGATITNNGTATGFGSGGTWGSITGTLSAQTDLNTALGLKANSSSLGTMSTQNANNVNITGGSISGGGNVIIIDLSTGGITTTGSIDGNDFTGSGAALTNLSATNIATGTLAVARGGTGITSFGTGVATWLGTPTKANLSAAVSDDDPAYIGTANTFNVAQTISAGTATTSAPPLVITQTWNGAGVTFTGPNIAITDTASSTSSALFSVTGGAAGATAKFKVTSDKTIITGVEAGGRVLDLVSAAGTAYFTVGGGGALFVTGGASFPTTGEVSGNEVGNSSNYLRIGYDSSDAVAFLRPSTTRLAVGVSAASPSSKVMHGGGARHGTDSNTTVTATLGIAGPPGSGTGTGGTLNLGYYAPTTTGSAIGTFTSRISLTGGGEILFSTKAAPSSASDTGTANEVRIADGYLYYCSATNTWLRAALSTW